MADWLEFRNVAYCFLRGDISARNAVRHIIAAVIVGDLSALLFDFPFQKSIQNAPVDPDVFLRDPAPIEKGD